MSKEKGFYKIRNFILCSIMLFMHTFAHAGFDKKSYYYKDSAPLVGAWAGELLGKPFEISLWPSPEFRRLTGAMIWGECKAALNFTHMHRGNYKSRGLSLPKQGIYKRLFKFGGLPESFIRKREKIDFKFTNNNCPKYFPGYAKKYCLYFISDPNFSTLTPYIQKRNQPTLEKQAGTLSRVKPTVQMKDSIQKLDRVKIYKLDSNAKITILDPGKKYLDVVESNKFKPGLAQQKPIQGQAGKSSRSLDNKSAKTIMIKSPAGFYVVSKKGINKVKILRHEKNNNKYVLDLYKVTGNEPLFKVGERTGRASWYYKTQQLRHTGIAKVPGLRRCNFWTKPAWSFSFKIIKPNVWKETNNFVTGRRPKSVCEQIRIEEDTCKWWCKRTPPPRKPGYYLVSDLTLAKNLYKKIAQPLKRKRANQGKNAPSRQQKDPWGKYWDQKVRDSRDNVLDNW